MHNGRSIWRDSVCAELPPYPGGAMDVDVAVIGSGLGGLSAALHVLRRHPGCKVVVLEANELGHGASSRSAGMLTPGVGQNLPGIVRRVGAARARAMYDATLRAVEYVRDLAAAEGIQCELSMTGQLVIARGRSGRRRLAALDAAFRQLDLPHEVVTDRELADVLRLARPTPGNGPAALRLPIAGVLNPGLLVSGLSQAVARHGGVLHSHARVTAIAHGRPARLTIAGGGEVRAHDVIMATDAFSDSLGVQRGRIIPMHLRVLLTAPLDDRQLERIGWARREGVIDSRRIFNYFRLTADRRILFGGGTPAFRSGSASDDRGSGHTSPRLEREFVYTFGEALGIRIERTWSGPMGYVLDTLPVIQRLRSHPSVVFIGGWCGHGIALSLTAGRWATDILDNVPLPDLPWFRSSAPLVPFAAIRRLAVPAGSWVMSLLDRL